VRERGGRGVGQELHGAGQRRCMYRGWSLWSAWRSRVGAEDGGDGLRLGVGSGGRMWDLRCGEKLVREGEL
jgi:hypothetical protein